MLLSDALPGTNWDYLQTASLLATPAPRATAGHWTFGHRAPGGRNPGFGPARVSGPWTAAVPIDYDRVADFFSPNSVTFGHNAYPALSHRHGSRSQAPTRIERLRWPLARLLLGAEPAHLAHPHRHLTFHYGSVPTSMNSSVPQPTRDLGSGGVDEPVSSDPTNSVTHLTLPPGPERSTATSSRSTPQTNPSPPNSPAY